MAFGPLDSAIQLGDAASSEKMLVSLEILAISVEAEIHQLIAVRICG